MKRRQAIGVLLALLLVFWGGILVGRQNTLLQTPPSSVGNATQNQPSVNFGLFWEAWNKLNDLYVIAPNDQDRLYGSIAGMTNALGDPYTYFLKPEAAKKFNDDITGNFEGIGAELVMKDNLLTVVSPLDNSPALKAGLKAGDVIFKIDGQDTPSTIDESIAKIRGTKGTVVVLTVARDGKPVEIKITRDRVDIKSVIYTKKETVGVIKINQFSGNTVELLDQSLAQAKKDGVKSIVLDLRNNPGGLLDVAVSVTSRFIDPNLTVVVERDKNKQESTLKTESATQQSNLPLVVLINKGSASASEIVAGALQDYGRAKLIGETSFGKGSVQSVQTLSDSSSLRVTIAEWLTPKKREINKIGIKPDLEVKISDEDIASNRDSQLDEAIKLLK